MNHHRTDLRALVPSTVRLSPLRWGRDFGVLGGAIGAAAPFFVVLDPTFALVAGFVGSFTGVALGVALALGVPWVRRWLPLPVLVAGVAALGSLWGAVTGALGGAASLWFGFDGIPLGFVLGGCTGMVALGAFFLPYLVMSVRGEATWPVVGAALLAAPFAGWAGLAALGASTFGLWLFALPVLLWLAVGVDRQADRLALVSSDPG